MKAHRLPRSVHPDGWRDRQTDCLCPSLSRRGDRRLSLGPPSVPALPTQTALHSHGAQTAAHTRAGSADSACNAAHAHGWHGATARPPPPPSFPQLARRSCKVRVQKALPAHSIPGATSPLRELGLLGRRELLPGDMAVGKGTMGAMGQHPSQGDRHSPLQAPWDPQHHPTGAPTPPVPIDSHTIPLIPTKACTFLLC